MLRMRRCVFAWVILSMAGCASTQTPSTVDTQQPALSRPDSGQYFVFFYRPGPAWVEGKSVKQQPIALHALYMDKLKRRGILKVGGPLKDDAGAFGILECEDLDTAERLIQEDPAIRNRIMVGEVHPWFPAVAGCVEKRGW